MNGSRFCGFASACADDDIIAETCVFGKGEMGEDLSKGVRKNFNVHEGPLSHLMVTAPPKGEPRAVSGRLRRKANGYMLYLRGAKKRASI